MAVEWNTDTTRLFRRLRAVFGQRTELLHRRDVKLGNIMTSEKLGKCHPVGTRLAVNCLLLVSHLLTSVGMHVLRAKLLQRCQLSVSLPLTVDIH